MLDSFRFYDIIGILVPGTLIVGTVPILFPVLSTHALVAGFPEGFSIIALLALAFFVGQLLQALGSFLEPGLYWTWGGRPGERAVSHGLGPRYLPLEMAKRIRKLLEKEIQDKANETSLFLTAMQLAGSTDNARHQRFNAVYAYHRGLLMLLFFDIVFYLLSMKCGAALTWPVGFNRAVLIGLVILLVLVWFRTKQRAFYYAREVLLLAEQAILDRRVRGRSV